MSAFKNLLSNIHIGLATSENETPGEKSMRLGMTLFTVTAITGLLLGIVEWGTRSAILNTRAQAKADALRNVMPAGINFKSQALAPENNNANITDVQEALDNNSQIVGWCISVSAKGYGGIVNFVVGITKDGAVKAINILSHSETPGLGAKSTQPAFYTQFNDKENLPLKVVKGAANGSDEIAAISGATVTSRAVTNGVNEAVEYFNKYLKKLGGK